MDDDSQALKSLLDLMFNLGTFDSSSDDETNQERSQGIDESSQILDIDSEPIAEPPYSTKQEPQPNAIVNLNSSLAINPEDNSSIQSKTDGADGAIASLQSLLFGSDVQTLKVLVNTHDRKIQSLEHQIYDSQELIRLLVPVITDILGIKVSEASTEITQAIAPVIDEMIKVNIEQDRIQMSVALAPVMSTAISQNIITAPGEFAAAIAPEMGMAIHEQLRINKGVMVDALYPIIGSTIAKYLAEAIKAINEKVEHTLSPEGISRKFRARMQGVSEAELILKESMPVSIRAIFLIHKASGLIISEVQNPSNQILESEMVAGMLTAIRSFVNDCITQSGFDTELSEIDYGGSKIMLEAAGCCYMAVVADGVTTPNLIGKIRYVLEEIVEVHSKDIENFDGDLATVPNEIKPALTQVFTNVSVDTASKPNILLIVILVIVAAIAIPWIVIHQRHQQEIQLKTQVIRTLANAPELSVYGLGVDVDQDRVNLIGRVPNSYLKDLAGKIAIAAISDKSDNKSITINNQIIPINIPPDPLLTKSEVKRVTALLNQLDGIKIAAAYSFDNKKVTITGSVANPTHIKTLNTAFAQIPGVAIVSSTIQVPPPPLPLVTTRIYFGYNSLLVSETQIPKILQMKSFMDRYPTYQLKIIGYSDRLGDLALNRKFSLNRAQVVRDLLIKAGLTQNRSVAIAKAESGQSELNSESNPDLRRYVGFELIPKVDNK